jgi:hypothetical protein
MALPSLQTTLKDWRMEVAKGTIVDHQAVNWAVTLYDALWARKTDVSLPLYPGKTAYVYTVDVIVTQACQLVINDQWRWELQRGRTVVPLAFPIPIGEQLSITCLWRGGWWPWRKCRFNCELILTSPLMPS